MLMEPLKELWTIPFDKCGPFQSIHDFSRLNIVERTIEFCTQRYIFQESQSDAGFDRHSVGGLPADQQCGCSRRAHRNYFYSFRNRRTASVSMDEPLMSTLAAANGIVHAGGGGAFHTYLQALDLRTGKIIGSLNYSVPVSDRVTTTDISVIGAVDPKNEDFITYVLTPYTITAFSGPPFRYKWSSGRGQHQ